MAAQHRIVVVVRHAKAERDTAEDHARRLSERGRRDSAAAAAPVAAALAAVGDGRAVALVSSAVRAVETWRVLASGLGTGSDVEERVEPALYDADAEDVIDLLATLGDDVGAAVVVGHNPTLNDTVRSLVSDGEADAMAQLEHGLSTAAVAVLAYDGGWPDLDAGTCWLEAVEVGRG